MLQDDHYTTVDDAKTSCRVETLAKTCSSRTSYLKSVFKRLTLGKDYFISQSGAEIVVRSIPLIGFF